MTSNLVDNASYFDDDTHVIPPHAQELLSSLSSISLQSLADSAVLELTGHHTSEPQPQVDNEAFAAMCAIVTCFARDVRPQTSIEQRKELEALGIKDHDLQSKLLPILTEVVPSLQRVLENTSFDFAHVVDVNWRLDYVLRTSSAGSVYETMYFVQLQLQSPCASESRLKSMTFSCSVEELRVLVYRIQEATNEVEKLAAGTAAT
ncbi:hypothetical protein CCR75_007133 [Bremia lactucae]|uniref:COMM domain-containing protein 3 n=1 Tax=Bremia lactucae TaxID=4779 RepID=A0A976FGN1_BRELC|nr:hypothetical protein CCR75_007133 [Bremia lactucae]